MKEKHINNHNKKHVNQGDLGYTLQEPLVNKIIIAIYNQSLHALNKDGSTIFSYKCATGDKNNITPKGTYYIDKRNKSLEKAKTYESGQFKGAKMPYPMYIDNARGIAIHGSGLVNIFGITVNTHLIPVQSLIKNYFGNNGSSYFGSHGCIRLSVDDALELYLHTPDKTMVIVKDLWVNDDK